MKTVTDPQVLESLITRLAGLHPGSQRQWGTLTAGEMLCHLGDASTSILTRRGGSELPNRRLRRWIGLYSGLPWPHSLRTPKSVDPHADGTRPAEFEADRARVIEGLRAIAAAGPDQLPPGHMVFGRMTAGDWHCWAYRHTDHHLRQFGL